MEIELICSVCQNIFLQPVILPCHHTVCFKCVETLISKNINRSVSSLSANSSLESVSESESESGRSNSDGSVAAVSETDSGYFGNSDEGSELKMTSLNRDQKFYSSLKRKDSYFLKKKVFSEIAMPTLPKSINCLACPVCQKTMFLDDRGASSLQKHKVMEKIVVNYKTAQLTPKEKNVSQRPLCEVCGQSSGAFSSSKCLQCNFSYCKQCEKSSHSDFSNHTVLQLENIDNCNTLTKQRPETNSLPFTPRTNTDYQLTTCLEHPTENLSLYCASCNASMCVLCQQEHKHVTHDVKAIGALFKQQKNELSRNMSNLTSKAKKVQEAIDTIKSFEEDIKRQANLLKAKLTTECNRIIEAVEKKKRELYGEIECEKNKKTKELQDESSQYSSRLRGTTGLLEYCVEVMNEDNASAYLQISKPLCKRLSSIAEQWKTTDFIDRKATLNASDNYTSFVFTLGKIHFKSETVPKPLLFLQEKEPVNETATLNWTLKPPQSVPSYQFRLEIDNGCHGPFREMYNGFQSTCTVNGLRRNSLYRARVLAFDETGYCRSSDILLLKTFETSHFSFETHFSDVKISNKRKTALCNGDTGRVVLGDTGFSTGVHYWEFTIDRWDAGSNFAFGVAVSDVDRRSLLGSNPQSWSLQGNEKENWIQHNSHVIKRNKIGLKPGFKIGIFLNLFSNSVSFYINSDYQGSIAFPQNSARSKTYFPAISMCGHVQIGLQLMHKVTTVTDNEPNECMPSTLRRSMSLNYRNKRPPLPPPRKFECSTLSRAATRPHKTFNTPASKFQKNLHQ